MTDDAIISALRVPARLTSLAFVRSAIACMLDRDSRSSEETGRLLLAVGEAVTNAIEHGSTRWGVVDVEVTLQPALARLVVTDQGDPTRPPRIDLAAPPPPEGSLRGRGLLIMRELSDEIHVEPVGDGTRLTMLFARPQAAARPQVRQESRAA